MEETAFCFYNVVPCSPGQEKLLADQMIVLEERTGIRIALYTLTLHPEGFPASRKAEYLTDSYRRFSSALAGSRVRPGVLHQSILGHWPRVDGNEEAWTRTINIEGEAARFCPLDPQYRQYIFNTIAALAKEKPCFFLGDDDIRGFSPHAECFCPLHTAEYNRRTGNSFTPGRIPAGSAEQNAEIMYEAVLRLLAELPSQKLTQVKAIGLTGQMHSVVLWNNSEVSPIVTWQDKRASVAGHLEEFRSLSGRPLSDGFGASTLAELARQNGLKQWLYAASPADWLAVRLTGIPEPVMDPTFAASWGIYDSGSGMRDSKAAAALDIPEYLLPRIVPSGSRVGRTRNVPGIPDGIPVIAPFGDNQASVLGTAQELEQELFLTLGTGAQLSLVVTSEQAAKWQIPAAVELRPFLNGRQLAVTAPLCGGRAWTWLGDSVNAFLTSLGLDPLPEKSLLDRLDALALESEDSAGLLVAPHFLGERHAPSERGSITGITLQNFTLPHLARALATGIVHSLGGSFPPELYQSRKRVVGSGNCVRFCQSIQREIELQFQLPLEIRSIREEAAVGAAKLAVQSASRD